MEVRRIVYEGHPPHSGRKGEVVIFPSLVDFRYNYTQTSESPIKVASKSANPVSYSRRVVRGAEEHLPYPDGAYLVRMTCLLRQALGRCYQVTIGNCNEVSIVGMNRTYTSMHI